MKLLLSGQAAAAISLQPPYMLFRLDQQPSPLGERFHHALRYFDGCTDVREVSVPSQATVDTTIEAEWAIDRALRLLLIGLEERIPDDRFEAFDSAEELLESSATYDGVRNRLCVTVIPIILDLTQLQEATSPLSRTSSLVSWLFLAQEAIGQMSAAFQSACNTQAYSESETATLYHQLSSDGVLLPLVEMIRQRADLSFEILRLANSYASHRATVSRWLTTLNTRESLKPKLKRKPITVEIEEKEDFKRNAANSSVPSHQAFERVRSQQRSIMELLRQRDVDGARRAAEDLVRNQRSNSSEEQIGKTLCVLAQGAKEHGLPDLQLEWARQATIESPADPVTFGHLADAYISRGELAYASETADKIANAGGRCFAEGCHARILRAMGNPNEGRERYKSAYSEFEGDPEAVYLLTGAADTLKEMGRVADAVSEYRALTESFPLNSQVWTGYGLALLAAGRNSEALTIFNVSTKHGGGESAALGRATALRQAGRYDEARRTYMTVLEAYPFNELARCGFAEMLLAEGKPDQSLDEFITAAEALPHSALAVAGRAKALFELGRFEDALLFYRDAALRFPHDERAAKGVVRALGRLGRQAEALRSAESYVSAFPFSLDLRALRSQILARIGNSVIALQQINSNLLINGHHSYSVYVKANILLGLDKPREALSILPKGRPVSRQDWRSLGLRSLANSRSGYEELALRELKSSVKNCPFFNERKFLRTVLSSILIKLKKFHQAREQVVGFHNETENVIAFRILALTHRKPAARELYATVKQFEKDPVVLSFADEVARRAGILIEPPRQSPEWLDNTHAAILLMRAA